MSWLSSTRLIVCALLALAMVGALTSRVDPALSHGLARPSRASGSTNLLYVSAGHLWLRSVDGGPARLVSTPWLMTGPGDSVADIQWSPDGRRVALDDAGRRLAVVNLAAGRVTVLLGRRCSGNCSPPTYAWSPNGRYLALVQEAGSSQRAVLRVWDSATGTTRFLLGGVSAYVAFPEWSHDSTRIAVEVGPLDVVKNLYPNVETVDLGGRVTPLGRGQSLSWSPDDRLVGIIQPNFCGANTCDEDVVVRSSAGGVPIVLARHSSSLFDNPIWAPRPQSYAFDRWLLNAFGRPLRRLAGPHERVLSWSPDGSRLALQTYYPYQGNPDSLYLSTPAGRRVHVYTDGWNQGCGACSKDVYGVTWGRAARFAWSTPTYPTPKMVTVYPKVFVSATGGVPASRIDVPSADIVNILGFVDGDRRLVIHVGKTVYVYTVATHRLTVLASGVAGGYATAILDPSAMGAY